MLQLAILIAGILAAAGLAWTIVHRRQRLRTHRAAAEKLDAVDLEAFLNLVDPAEELYLKSHLPGKTYAAVRRARIRAILAYLQEVSDNAAIMILHAEQAITAADAGIRA